MTKNRRSEFSVSFWGVYLYSCEYKCIRCDSICERLQITGRGAVRLRHVRNDVLLEARPQCDLLLLRMCPGQWRRIAKPCPPKKSM